MRALYKQFEDFITKNLYFLATIFICIIFNEYTLVILDKNPPLSIDARIGIWSFNLALLFSGFIMTKRLKLLNILIVLISLVIPILLFESLLRMTTIFDQVDRPYPSYIPPYLKELDRQIFNSEGFMTEDGFRTWKQDVVNLRNELINDQGCKIVVLGDSFVMGDGLPASETWPAKLEKLIDCNVYPFGQNGWSSLEQFEYYENNLKDLSIDYVIVGVTSNDPHPLGNFCGLDFSESDYIQRHISLIKSTGLIGGFLDNSYAFNYMDQVIDGFFTPLIGSSGNMSKLPITSWGYANWEKRLYEDDVYDLWLQGVNCFVTNARHPIGFLLTPTTISLAQRSFFSKIEDSLNTMNQETKNIYPKLSNIIDPDRERSNWANLADAHPGRKQTTLYSYEALLLLNNLGYDLQ